jgi:glycerol-3-phosphate dehydrogenase
MNSRICLIGYGYWGKILHKTLKSMGCSNVVVVDQVLENLNEINENFSHYFIATNFESHIDVIKKLSKFRDKKIWCEKSNIVEQQ